MGTTIRTFAIVGFLIFLLLQVVPDYDAGNIFGYRCQSGQGIQALLIASLIFAGFVTIGWQIFNWYRSWSYPPFDERRPRLPDWMEERIDQIRGSGNWGNIWEGLQPLLEPFIADLLKVLGVGIGAFACLIYWTVQTICA